MNSNLKTIIKIYLSTLAISQLCRLLFIISQLSRSAEQGLGRILNSMAHGVIHDISIAGWVTIPLLCVAAATMVSGAQLTRNPLQRLIRAYLCIVAIIIATITTVDANLFGYWGYRLDSTVLPYLATPKEASASISLGDILLGGLIFLAALAPSIWIYFKATNSKSVGRCDADEIYDPTNIKTKRKNRSSRRYVWLLILVALIAGGMSYSSLGGIHFSSHLFANQIATNPVYSLFATLKGEEIDSSQYQFIENSDELNMLLGDFSGDLVSRPVSILNTKRPNIVIVICESYSRSIMDLDTAPKKGADTVAVMPNLRRIASDGVSMERAIASGTRTDKGLVSILSGFVSQPQISILNYPEKSANLQSIASTLAQEGYRSSFYYGGDLNYMNMRPYLKGSGWERLVDATEVKGSTRPDQRWGWSDEVMMDRFADDVIAMSAESKSDDGAPFIATLLTLSSHEPFDTPESMGFDDPLLDAMCYSDAKLGEMYDRLKESEAWDDMLLIVVGDHATNYPRSISYNSPARHHIPLIFGGGALSIPWDAPLFDTAHERIVSQCDIVATILSQMEIDRKTFTFSMDIFNIYTARNDYAYYTFNNGFGIVRNNGSILYDITSDIAGVTFYPIEDNVKYTQGMLLMPGDYSYLKIGKCVVQQTFIEIEKL